MQSVLLAISLYDRGGLKSGYKNSDLLAFKNSQVGKADGILFA
jgi:hypothetical protein